MTKKLFLATILMLSLIAVGCSSNSTNKSASNNNNNIVEESPNNNNSSETKPQENEKKPEEKVNKVKLSLYTEDANSMEIKESSTIEVNEDLSLDNKLKELGNALSEKVFDKLPMEVKSIDTVNGKKVATINLKDSGNSKWSSKFQGSTGGQITGDSLIETFLQVKYKNGWIDGVKFLYNNEPIEYDHVSNLSEIQYRN